MNAPTKKLTIDVLILQTLEGGQVVTPRELSRIWGEDRVRVGEWLERFRRLNLCEMCRDGQGHGLAYRGYPAEIRCHLNALDKKSEK